MLNAFCRVAPIHEAARKFAVEIAAVEITLAQGSKFAALCENAYFPAPPLACKK